jgi:ubiquinone/menaquinone biosynthesis C-methylase UbiE
MPTDDYIESNRKMWNGLAKIHARGYVNDLLERIQAPDFSTFDEVEKRIFSQVVLAGKSVVQLACNNGRELISVKKAGAGRCVGVDLSEGFIEQARQLASLANVDVEFICTNVYELPHDLDGSFDLVYITIGVFGWLADVDTFIEIIARLLKPGGQLFIYEMHPILNMFEAEKGLEIDDSYFRVEPFVDDTSPDYYDPSQVVEGKSYWFPYKLSDIIGGCLKHGLSLEHFEEYGHDLSMVYAAFEHFDKKPPLSFSLLARKTA